MTSLYDKRDNFSVHVVNFPHLGSNIPIKPAYGTMHLNQLELEESVIPMRNLKLIQTLHTKATKLVKQGYNLICYVQSLRMLLLNIRMCSRNLR